MVTINPDVFVQPPFISCPECGQPRFGVNGVGSHSVIRACLACRFMGRMVLPLLDKRILFVDQSALSKMLHVVAPLNERKDAHHDFWRALFLRLDSLVHMQLIACPFTSVHVEESMMDSRKVHGLDWIARRLAADTEFEDRHEIELAQVVDCAVAWLQGRPIVPSARAMKFALRGDRTKWLDTMMIRWFGNWPKEVVDTVRNVRDEIHRDTEEVYERWRASRMPFDARVREEAMGFGKAKIAAEGRRLLRWQEIQKGNAKLAEGDLNLEAASAVQRIFAAFLACGLDGMTATVKVVEFLRSEALVEIPSIRLSSMLQASVAREAEEGRATKNRPSRGATADFAAISTSLPVCNAMFVDNECARFLQRDPLAKELERYGCRVFSLNTKDELMEYLDEIATAASREHLELVAEIYGPMPMELPAPPREPTKRKREGDHDRR